MFGGLLTKIPILPILRCNINFVYLQSHAEIVYMVELYHNLVINSSNNYDYYSV